MVLNDSYDANQSVMDDSVYIEEAGGGGSESDIADVLAEADEAKAAGASSAVAGASDVGATTGNPDIPNLEEVESAEEEASKKTCYILVGIVLLGLAIIGIVLGVTLSGGSSGSSDGAQGPAPSAVVGPTFSPIEPIDPTPAPVGSPDTSSPMAVAPVTPAPTTASPTTTAPVTPAPTTLAPITSAPVVPTTPQPITPAPIIAPVGFPTTFAPLAPTVPTVSPVTPNPTTVAPVVVTVAPTTLMPTPPPTVLVTERPTSAVQAIIAQVALQGGAEFDDPTSVQSLSLEWLEGNANVATYTDQKIVQRYVCGCIHFSTSGVANPYWNPEETEWMISDGWLTDDDECTWYGLTCDVASGTMITEIDLRGNNVTGTFPAEVQLLAASLTLFDIGNNKVFNLGEEVEFLGALTSLQTLDIGNTYFEYDGIPPGLGNLVNLIEMDISYTLFFGPIRGPEVFSNLVKLDTLQMGGNAYNQGVPAEIAQLPALTRFYCDNSLLTGNIEFIADMPVIFEFWVDDNPNLGGTIPTSIGDKFQSLQSLSVTDCSFSGTIPTEMGNLLQMQLLWLYGNPLTGPVPEVLGTLQNLVVFDISDTMLTGSMPDGICARAFEFDYVASDCEEVECCCCTDCISATCAI